MNILSLQSAVAYGYVGNSAATFPLQRLGFEVWPVDTVQFSNHPVYGQLGGDMASPNLVRAVIDGLTRLGVLGQCDAVLSGYLGDAATAPTVLDAVQQVRALKPDAVFLCDPVMGDDTTGRYVRDGIPQFMAEHLVPAADIITPNRFELQRLTGHDVTELASATTAARMLLDRGPRMVVVTSLPDPAGIACVMVTAQGAWAVRTPWLAFDPAIHGSGDCLSALLLAHILRNAPPPEALSLAVSSLFGVLEQTLALGRRELALVQAQNELVQPSRLFAPEAVDVESKRHG
ncbi:MAG: pyridoxal kinase PdxY [Rhodospirillaceae bacterium]|nr:pyridoxal kinase PdxY [Rhodospirillales bacterium]